MKRGKAVKGFTHEPVPPCGGTVQGSALSEERNPVKRDAIAVRRWSFTLVEVMIVVAVLGILAMIAIPNFAVARRSAQANACKANLKQLAGCVISYNAEYGEYPGALSQLTPLYIRKLPNCPGNAALQYYYNVATGDVGCIYNSSHNIYDLSGGDEGGEEFPPTSPFQ